MKQSTLLKRLESLLNTTRQLNEQLARYNMCTVDTVQLISLIKQLKAAEAA
jgi:hypothetical protein